MLCACSFCLSSIEAQTLFLFNFLGRNIMYENYYTPTIEEFYVGFECEFFNRMQDKIWKHQICNVDDVSMAYDANEHGTNEWDDSIEKTFRVKYLDIDDLIEIGFEHIGGKLLKDVGQLFIFNNKRYFVHLNYTRFSDRCIIKIETSVFENSIRTLVVHSIGIKNKSELLKLMSQLNIL
jgi:hypothetical protein